MADAGLKMMIRSVLQSVKDGVPARKLPRDYQEITGEPIPFRKLGFPSVDALLASMPDVVYEDWVDGERCYKAVADETTAHIEKMVSRQKSNKKRKKGGTFFMRRPTVNARRGVRPSVGYRNQPHVPHPAYPRPPTYYQQPRSLRNIEESPRGSMRVTFQPTPPHTKPSLASRLGPSPPATSSDNDTIKFGDNYKVPPRFQRIVNQNVTPPKDLSRSRRPAERLEPERFEGTVKYVPILATYLRNQSRPVPNFETMETAGGYVSVINLMGLTHGSGGIFASSEEAQEACAQAACKSLGCLKDDSFNAKQESSNGTRNYSKIDIAKFRDRTKVLVNRRPNGLWFSRLPVEYQQRYNEDPPPDIDRLILEWTDIVEIQGQDNLRILYPVTNVTPTAPSRSKPTTSSVQPRLKQPDLNPVPWASPDKVSQASDADLGYIEAAKLPEIGSTGVVVYLSYVEHVGRFFVHLKGCQITELTLEANNRCGSGKPVTLSQLGVGKYVAAQCADDQCWYRAQVLSVVSSRPPKSEVFYSDFGNSEQLPLDQLRELPKSLYQWPIQAVQCRIQEDHLLGSDEATETLNKYIDSLMKMTVNDHQDNVCVVTLFDENGTRVFEDKPPKATDPEPLELPADDQWDVVITSIVSANAVILRLVDQKYSEKLTALEELIAKTPIPAASRYVPEVGDLCAALVTTSTADDDIPWYRVRVQEVDGDKALCEYLDYGDADIVPASQLRPLLVTEAELPYQAVVAYLTGLDGCETNTEVVRQLTDMVLDKPCIAIVNSRDGDPSITLYDTSTAEDININEVITEVINVRDLLPTLPRDAEMSEGYVSYIASDGVVHLQIQGPGLVKLETYTKKVTNIFAKGGAEYFVKNLKDGRLVMALFRDGGWYRAIIRQVLPNRQVLVHFVDYGNEEVIPCTSLRELEVASKTFSSLPYQAIAATLESLPPPGFSWSPEAVTELSERAPDDQTVCIQTVQPASDHALPTVNLSHCIDNEFYSINSEMSDPAIWMDLTEVRDINSLEATKQPTQQGSTQLFTVKAEVQEETNTTLNVTSGSEGESFSDASVTSQQTTELLRQLRDLGIPVTDMGAAGDDMFYGVSDKMAAMNMNPGGECGLLTKAEEPPVLKTEPAGMGAPVSVISRTLETAASPGVTDSVGSLPDVTVKTTPRPSSKDLNSNDTIKLSPQSAAEYSRLALPPPMEAPSSGTEVFVTWAADPSDFTCVVYSQLEVIEDMMNSMAVFYYKEGDALTVDQPEVGTLYAGLYEDERWYRVRIKNVVNQPLLGNTTMVSALLVDFGSFNLLRVTALRQLTSAFRRLPCQAIRASLAGVSPEAGIWSEEAVSHFEERVLEKRFVASVHSRNMAQSLPMTLVDVEAEGEEALIHKNLIAAGLAVSSPIAPH